MRPAAAALPEPVLTRTLSQTVGGPLAAPYYRFFVGDYLRDAGHLSLLEHGAYRRLIDLYMTTSEALPFDMPRLYRLLHATSKEEQQAVQVVVEEFFLMDGMVLRHKRCDRELSWQNSVSEAAKAAVTQRERKRNQQLAIGRSSNDARSIILPEPEPEPEPKKEKKETGRNSRGTRLQITALPPDWSAWARQKFPKISPERVFASFRDYWIAQPGQRGVKVDWFATWRNWLRRDNPREDRERDADLISSIASDPRFSDMKP